VLYDGFMNEYLSILLSGAVGGAIVSSLIAPYLNRYQERRKIKADVLKALMNVELSRWSSRKNSFEHYMKDIQELRASAMIARAHRPLIEFYVQASALARSGSDDDFESSKDNEFGGSIDTDVSEFVSDSAALLTDYLWHPHLSRLHLATRLQALRTTRAKLQKKYSAKKSPSRHIYDWERII